MIKDIYKGGIRYEICSHRYKRYEFRKSIEFYEKVFCVSPVKVKTDYAKFLLEKPGLNFTLNVRDEVKGNQVNHFGFQVDTAEEITLHKERLEKEGFFARDEMDTTCCYAVQDKFWVTDPMVMSGSSFIQKQIVMFTK